MVSFDTFTADVPKDLLKDPQYQIWEDSIDQSVYIKIMAALKLIEDEGIITGVKYLGQGLYEKKWSSGLRLFFSVVEMNDQKTLLILGANKNSQNRAIRLSRKILKQYRTIYIQKK